MNIKLAPNEINYIKALLRKDAKDRKGTDVAGWVNMLALAIEDQEEAGK